MISRAGFRLWPLSCFLLKGFHLHFLEFSHPSYRWGSKVQGHVVSKPQQLNFSVLAPDVLSAELPQPFHKERGRGADRRPGVYGSHSCEASPVMGYSLPGRQQIKQAGGGKQLLTGTSQWVSGEEFGLVCWGQDEAIIRWDVFRMLPGKANLWLS